MSEISDFFFENNIILVLKIKLKTISFEIDFAQSANQRIGFWIRSEPGPV